MIGDYSLDRLSSIFPGHALAITVKETGNGSGGSKSDLSQFWAFQVSAVLVTGRVADDQVDAYDQPCELYQSRTK